MRRRTTLKFLTDRRRKPVRLPMPSTMNRPVLRGTKSYLRALREAELAAWNATVRFPTFALAATLLFAFNV